MANEKARKMMRMFKRKGIKAAFREPNNTEIQAVKQRRPYLELACEDPGNQALVHDKVLLDEGPTGWGVMDVRGTRLITSPGKLLLADYPWIQVAKFMFDIDEATESAASETAESPPTEESSDTTTYPPEETSDQQSLGEAEQTESEGQGTAPLEGRSGIEDEQGGEEEITEYNTSSYKEMIAATEHLVAMAYNYEWPTINIQGTPFMSRVAWVLLEAMEMKHSYQPSQDDQRCYHSIMRHVQAYEYEAKQKGAEAGYGHEE